MTTAAMQSALITETKPASSEAGFPARVYTWYVGGTFDQGLVKACITIQLVLLSLSLIHQTNAVAHVTGMSWWLAFMQAVVQDFGLFISELVLIRFQQTGKSKLWAAMFVVFAALASGSANVFDFTRSLETFSVNWWLSAGYGASVPMQVLLLGKMVSQLVEPKAPRKADGKQKDAEEPVSKSKAVKRSANGEATLKDSRAPKAAGSANALEKPMAPVSSRRPRNRKTEETA